MATTVIYIADGDKMWSYLLAWVSGIAAPQENPQLLDGLGFVLDHPIDAGDINTALGCKHWELDELRAAFEYHGYSLPPQPFWYERVGMVLTELVYKTVDSIRANQRTDGVDLPLQADRAAAQVTATYNLTGGVTFIRLWHDAQEIQREAHIVANAQALARTSLTGFVAACAKRVMGHEYDNLLYQRNQALVPTGAGAE